MRAILNIFRSSLYAPETEEKRDKPSIDVQISITFLFYNNHRDKNIEF